MIRPNRSLTWREAAILYAALATISLTIAVAFFSLGLTLILPFSGLELLALGGALWLCLRRSERQEVVTVTERQVRVEFGRRRPAACLEFQRPWVRVVVERPSHDWYPSRLMLRSHGRSIEIGSFLNEGERQMLAGQLVLALKTGSNG